MKITINDVCVHVEPDVSARDLREAQTAERNQRHALQNLQDQYDEIAKLTDTGGHEAIIKAIRHSVDQNIELNKKLARLKDAVALDTCLSYHSAISNDFDQIVLQAYVHKDYYKQDQERLAKLNSIRNVNKPSRKRK